MLYYIKRVMMLLLIWHVFIFYMGIYVHPNNNNYCICGSNPITSTIYICSKNILGNYLLKIVPGIIREPIVVDPYTYIYPLKVIFQEMVCA